MSAAAMAVAQAVGSMSETKVEKPVNPKTGKGGKTVIKGIKGIKSETAGIVAHPKRKVVALNTVEVRAVTRKAVEYLLMLNDDQLPADFVPSELERAQGRRLLARLAARH